MKMPSPSAESRGEARARLEGPIVTTIMAARNAERTLAAAIESVLSQTIAEWELLIVDDQSTDETSMIARKYAADDRRIRLLEGPGRGAAEARNVALRQAKGDWTAILDSDDIAMPSRFAEQRAFMEANPDLALSASWALLFVREGEALGLSSSREPRTREQLEAMKAQGKLLVLCHPTVMWNTARLRELGGYRPEYHQGEDAEAINRAVYERNWPILVMAKALVWYRIADTGLSTSDLAHQRTVLRYLEDRNRVWTRNEPERTMEEFLEEHGSFRTRARWWRHDLGALLYRKAGVNAGGGRWLKATWAGVRAAGLHPRYVVSKIWRQTIEKQARQLLSAEVDGNDAGGTP